MTVSERYRTLVAYCCGSTFTQTTLDYLNAFSDHLPSQVDYLHVTRNAHPDLNFDDYDVIINSYCARFSVPNYVSDDYAARLRNFQGLKIIAVQDEYENTNLLKKRISENGFHVVLTCVPQSDLDYVYPKSELPNVRFLTVLTGYVPPFSGSVTASPRPLRERPITIGYRGRDIGSLFGRLGFDKYEIGRRMKEVCNERGIVCDIAMDDASRIYGSSWFDFIASCQSMLGTESGSNIFDFDGALRRKFDEMTEANGGRRPSYAEFEPFTAKLEQQISMGQISPRVFECALMGTPMVLFRGRYSDIIEPGTHYIALERDFSNVDEVLDRLGKLNELEAMADRAHRDLIASGSYGYARFAKIIDDVIREELPKNRARLRRESDGKPEKAPDLVDPLYRQVPTVRPAASRFLVLQMRYAELEREIKELLTKRDDEVSSHRRGFDRLRQQISPVALHPHTSTQHISAAIGQYGELIDKSEQDFARLEQSATSASIKVRGSLRSPDDLALLNEQLLSQLKEVYVACERSFSSYHATSALIKTFHETSSASEVTKTSEGKKTRNRGISALPRFLKLNTWFRDPRLRK